MCWRWPASGTSPRSRSALGSAASGRSDISSRWMCRCRTNGWRSPPGRASAASSRRSASTRARPERGLAGQRVPERPGGDVDECVRRQRQHVEVLRVCGGHLRPSRRRRPRARPARCPRPRRRHRRERRASAATRPAAVRRRGCPSAARVQRFAGQLELRPCPVQARGQVDGVERLPALVVVGADRVGDAPVRRPQIRVLLQRLLEARHRLFVVERVGPHQPPVEPHLSRGRGGRHRAVVVTEVVVRVAHGSSVGRARRPPPPLARAARAARCGRSGTT